MSFGTSYLIKFGGEKKTNIKEDWFHLVYASLPVLVITYFCYASIYLFYNGTDAVGKILKIESKIEWEGSGQDSYPVKRYYCFVDNFSSKIECDKTFKVGENLYYLYSPKLPHSPPFISNIKKSRLDMIVDNGSPLYFASIIYCISLFLVWFESLFRRGLVLLNLKKSKENSKLSKFLFTIFYLISYVTFILFVLAFFKNIYNIISFKFWNIAATTFGIIIILLTDWGEKLFEFSNNIILSLKTYKVISYIKQVIKIITYISFALVLFQSLTHSEKSVFDITIEFINKHFDINLKNVLDFKKNSKLKAYLKSKHERTTLVLPIVGLDIQKISSGNSTVLWFGARRKKPSFSS